MEKDFQKIVEAARRISLSYDEKDSIRHMLKHTIGLNDALVLSRFKFLNLRFIAVTLGAFIILGASASFAAENTLPGNPLYNVKTFNEKINGFLTLSPEASALWQVKLADRRLEETQRLNATGKLDENARAALEFKFETNANQFNKEIKALRLKNKLKQAGELASKLESVIENRRKTLSDIADRENHDNNSSEINVILNKVNLRSEQLMSEQQDIQDEIGNDSGDDNVIEIKGILR